MTEPAIVEKPEVIHRSGFTVQQSESNVIDSRSSDLVITEGKINETFDLELKSRTINIRLDETSRLSYRDLSETSFLFVPVD